MYVDPVFLPPPAYRHRLLTVIEPPVAKSGDEVGGNRPAGVAEVEPSPRHEERFEKSVQVGVVAGFVRDIGRDQALAGFSDRVPPVEIGHLVTWPCPVPDGVVGGENQCVLDIVRRFDAPAQARQRYADEPQSTAQLDRIHGWQTPFEQPSGKAQGGRPDLGPVREPLMGIRLAIDEPVEKCVGIHGLDDGELEAFTYGYGGLPGIVLAQGSLQLSR